MFAVISFFYSGKNAMGRVMAFRQLFHCDLNAQNMKETIRDTKMMMTVHIHQYHFHIVSSFHAFKISFFYKTACLRTYAITYGKVKVRLDEK